MPSLCKNCPTKALLSQLLYDLNQRTTAANVHTLAQPKQSVGSMLEILEENETMCDMCTKIATNAKGVLENNYGRCCKESSAGE